MFSGRGGRSGHGGPGRDRSQQKEQKTQPIVHEYSADLSELYNGKETHIEVTRSNFKVKNGKDISNCVKMCSACNGSGVVTRIQQMGPIIQQMQAPCTMCKQQGKIFTDDIEIFEETVKLKINIEKGMQENEKIILYEESHKEPNVKPGDVIVVLKQKTHKLFHRSKNDLLHNMSINFIEALCGFQKTLQTLDNRTLLVQSSYTLKQDELSYIKNEGMPSKENPSLKGNLILKFDIEYPDTLTREQKKILMEAFYLPEFIKTDPKYEFVKIKKYNETDHESNSGNNAYDSDEDSSHPNGNPNGNPIECAQQ